MLHRTRLALPVVDRGLDPEPVGELALVVQRTGRTADSEHLPRVGIDDNVGSVHLTSNQVPCPLLSHVDGTVRPPLASGKSDHVSRFELPPALLSPQGQPTR